MYSKLEHFKGSENKSQPVFNEIFSRFFLFKMGNSAWGMSTWGKYPLRNAYIGTHRTQNPYQIAVGSNLHFKSNV